VGANSGDSCRPGSYSFEIWGVEKYPYSIDFEVVQDQDLPW